MTRYAEPAELIRSAVEYDPARAYRGRLVELPPVLIYVATVPAEAGRQEHDTDAGIRLSARRTFYCWQELRTAESAGAYGADRLVWAAQTWRVAEVRYFSGPRPLWEALCELEPADGRAA